jgi:hypothetical protein
MNKTNFVLPNTKMCVVVWYRDGKKMEDILIETPKSNNDLRNTMLMNHRVGFSEIRALKAVDTNDLEKSISQFRRW